MSAANPRLISRVTCCVLLGVLTSAASAGPRDQAKRIHDRLTGVPPTPETLTLMSNEISNGNGLAAAEMAMQHPAFINSTVREFATPLSNREQSVYAPLNDTTATIMGMVRDGVPFDRVLYEDIVYVGASDVANEPFAIDNNDHYVDLQDRAVDLSDPDNLERATQSSLNPDIPAAQTAGVMTTRGYAEAFLVAGTNRAAVRFATLNFLCMDMEDMRDVTAWPDRIRQDVTRSPGGDSSIFLNDCLACHAGLDALSGAFAHLDFDEETLSLVYTPGVVQEKFLRDAGTFKYGYETLGDSWVNYWRTGPNSHVGWRGPGSGMGAKSLGMELADTQRFAQCQVTRVFEKVCYRTPNGPADLQAVEQITGQFQANNLNLRTAFAQSALHCMGE